MNHLRSFLLGCLLLLQFSSKSQYILNGSAEKVSCNCYTLTPAQTFKSGSVWNSNKINLNTPFDFWFNVFLGCGDAGADGMVFILQPISTSVGSSGEGMGFGGVQPSIGIALDTYQNGNLSDPDFDHISIQANGAINHNADLAGPVPISATTNNVEDCQWHRLRITWDPATQWLRAFFDGVLRVEKQVSLIASIFGNDPNVYWGFTGATGGFVNLQQFCTALNPDFTTSLPSNIGCAPATVQFSNQSQSFAPITSYNWSFGNGNTSTSANPPPQTYAQAGTYKVELSVTGMDGCQNDTTLSLTVGEAPQAALQVGDTCFGKTPGSVVTVNSSDMLYQWDLNGTTHATTTTPPLAGLPPGNHELSLVLRSPYGCGQPDTATAAFHIRPLPQIDFDFAAQCRQVQFNGQQLDNATTIQQWNWRFGDNSTSNSQNPLHLFGNGSQFTVSLWAAASNGCTSDTAFQTVTLSNAQVSAGNDTVVIKGQPFTFNGSGNGSFTWFPTAGLSDPFIARPQAIINADGMYTLTVTTAAGCVATDSVRIKVYEGPAVYVPTAFTPNGDGLNDLLRPVYVGIAKLERFAIYNRWGGEVFATNDPGRGWDGRVNGVPAATGTYVWMAKGIEEGGKRFAVKGTLTVIR